MGFLLRPVRAAALGFGERLRAVDRIGANCYEDLYVGMGTAKPTPALLPFSYAASGFSPATFRRGVPIARLRKHPNPFPLVMLPQHRLENVWAMSSVLHEVSHNLQADLGLWDAIPERIFARLTGEAKLPSRSPGSGRAGTRRRRPTCWRCCSAGRPRSSR